MSLSHKPLSLKSFLPAVIWFIISFVLLIIPGDDLPGGVFSDIPFFDKFVHLFMFFLLTALFSYPLAKRWDKHVKPGSVFLKIALLVILYGIAMEFVQKYFVRNRSFDVADILFDALGSAAGLWFIRQIILLKNRPR